MAMAMAMAKKQKQRTRTYYTEDSNWEAMLKRRSLEKKSDVPHQPHVLTSDGRWRWRTTETLRAYVPQDDIAEEVFMISCQIFSWVNDRIDDLEEDEWDHPGYSEDNINSMAEYDPAEVEKWMDELQGFIEYIDLAVVLHADRHLDCLLPLLLCNNHASIRAKAAELVTAMLHNSPLCVKCVINANGLSLLLYNLTSVLDENSRTKALGAISGLIRNDEFGMAAFRLEMGFEALRDALHSEKVSWGALSSVTVRFQRDALNLIQYLLHENSSDCNIVTELGLHRIMMHLTSSDDAEVREAALGGLLVLARDDEGGDSGQLVKNDDKLKQVLQERIAGISAMAPEDLGAAREERQLVDSLWNACYNEPSSLGEMGLLVLPAEDVPSPDVASKLFEPPLRAWAAAEAADRNSVIEKDYNIVTDLGLPRIMMHLVSSDDAEVREAAIKGLLVLARDEEGGDSGQLVKNDDKLKQVLEERIEGISAMTPEDLGVARMEIQLVDSLWNACYNEPSSLEEKGLLVLPGEDAPDVASKLFKPPSAATPTVQDNSSSKRRKLH